MANTDTKCPLLWNHLHISLGGNHSPCCHSQVFKDQGSWKEISWGQFDSKLGIVSALSSNTAAAVSSQLVSIPKINAFFFIKFLFINYKFPI